MRASCLRGEAGRGERAGELAPRRIAPTALCGNAVPAPDGLPVSCRMKRPRQAPRVRASWPVSRTTDDGRERRVDAQRRHSRRSERVNTTTRARRRARADSYGWMNWASVLRQAETTRRTSGLLTTCHRNEALTAAVKC